MYGSRAYCIDIGYPASCVGRCQGTYVPHTRLTKAIFLPEASDFIARNAAETVKITKEAGPIDCNAFIKGLQEQAVESAVSVTAGVHLPTDSETHVRRPAESDYKCANTAIWISPCGKVEHTYQKLHTFDVNIKGGAMLMESKSTQRGSQITRPFASPIGNIGLAICYDVWGRISSLFRALLH
jgi:predicted amidohydrolase